MEERNSEGKATGWYIATAIVSGIAVIIDKLLGAGVFNDWPTVVTMLGLFGTVSKLLGDYVKSRPGKHAAMAEKAKVALAEKEVAAANP